MFDFLLRRHIPDTALVQYRDGLLDADRARMLEAHMLLCPTCQLQLEGLLPAASAIISLQLCGAH
jgi:hypothetical protein